MVNVNGRFIQVNNPQVLVFIFQPHPGNVKPVIGILLHSEGLLKSLHY